MQIVRGIGSGLLQGRLARLAPAVLGCLTALLIDLSPANAAPTLPPSFDDQLVASPPGGPTALAFVPDGRLLIATQTGSLYVYKNGALVSPAALNISAKTCSSSERGMLGVAVDPLFAATHHVFIYYTFNNSGTCVNRVSRFVLGDNDVVDPVSEVVLIDNIPSPFGTHNAGDLQFGKQGLLYVSVGDGGCDYAGDSGCNSSNDAARDQFVLLGKILRINRDGEIPAGNPFQGPGTARCNVTGRTDSANKCQETYAWGLRNPFRIPFDPNGSETRFFINDVGASTWEEIDLGQAAADYGWNVREGFCVTGSSSNCGPQPLGMTNPIHAYNHDTGCYAITGGAFVPLGIWPTEYDNAYLYGDYGCGKIFELSPVQGGGYSSSEFATAFGSSGIVSMTFGPFGSTQALYYVTYNGPGQQVRRIVYTGQANRSPTARLSASPAYGSLPLTVNFNGTASTDPDGDALSYDWDFGDGSAHATTATASHTYTTAGTYTATLTVSDGRGGQNSTTVRIDAGNTPPVPLITAPSPSKLFRVGEQITLSGSATDPEDGPLSSSALSWTVVKHHSTHTHPFLPPTQGNDVPITAPPPEDLQSTTNSYLEIQLTATDSKGLSRTITQNLNPHLVDVTFNTAPSGFTLTVDGSSTTTPRTYTSWESYGISASASGQNDGSGNTWMFAGWSDGGAASHTFQTPASPATYTATFTPRYPVPVGASPLRTNLVPAFNPCDLASADSAHGTPLNFASCSSPTPSSSTARIGSNSIGFARIVVCNVNSSSVFCNPAGGVLPKPDVRFTGSIRDVECAPTLPVGQTACAGPGVDYNPNGTPGPYTDAGDGTTGAQPPCFPSASSDSTCVAGADLTVAARIPNTVVGGTGTKFQGRGIRITDRNNGATQAESGTLIDLGFPIPLDCMPTADTTVGSTCGVNTTANALAPGIVRAGNIAVWEIGEIVIRDSGPDGVRGNADDELFATQGVFLP